MINLGKKQNLKTMFFKATRFFKFHKINERNMKKFFLIIFIAIGLTSFSQTIELKKGLVAHFNFDNNSTDLSGNGNTLILPNGGIFTKNISGDDNQAIKLNNAPAKIKLAKAPIYLPEYCISFWVKPTENTTSEDIIHKTLFKNQDGCTEIYFDNYALYFDFSYKYANGSGSSSTARGFEFEKDKWYFICLNFKENKPIFITENDKTYKLDIDGIEKFGEFNELILIGANLEGKESFNGVYDDFRLYNRNLNQDEINNLYLNKAATTKEEILPNKIVAPPKDSLIIAEAKPDLTVKKPDSTAKAIESTTKPAEIPAMIAESKANIVDSSLIILPAKTIVKDSLATQPTEIIATNNKPATIENSLVKSPETNQTKESLPVVETTAPVLTILSPDLDLNTHRKTEIEDKIFISGTATDASGISEIKINDKNVNFNSKTGWRRKYF
jgi:hypothetical protein